MTTPLTRKQVVGDILECVSMTSLKPDLSVHQYPNVDINQLRQTIAQQAQEIERLEGVCLDRLRSGQRLADEYLLLQQQLAAMTTERDEQCKSNVSLQVQLAAMTAERDEAEAGRKLFRSEMGKMLDKLASILNMDRNEAGYENGLDILQQQLATAQARCKELEKAHFTELKERLRYNREYHDAKRTVMWGKWCARLLTQRDTARQDAARLRELIKQVVNDLPTKRDWLDPDLEAALKGA